MLLNWIWFAIGTASVLCIAYMVCTDADPACEPEVLIALAAFGFVLSIWASTPMIGQPLYEHLTATLPQPGTDIQLLTVGAILLAGAGCWLAILVAVSAWVADVRAKVRALRTGTATERPHPYRLLFRRTLSQKPSVPMLILAGPITASALTLSGWLLVKVHALIGWSPATLGFGPSGEGFYPLWLIGFMNLAFLGFGWWLGSVVLARMRNLGKRSMSSESLEFTRQQISRDRSADRRAGAVVALCAVVAAAAVVVVNGDWLRAGIAAVMVGCMAWLAVRLPR